MAASGTSSLPGDLCDSASEGRCKRPEILVGPSRQPILTHRRHGAIHERGSVRTTGQCCIHRILRKYPELHGFFQLVSSRFDLVLLVCRFLSASATNFLARARDIGCS